LVSASSASGPLPVDTTPIVYSVAETVADGDFTFESTSKSIRVSEPGVGFKTVVDVYVERVGGMYVPGGVGTASVQWALSDEFWRTGDTQRTQIETATPGLVTFTSTDRRKPVRLTLVGDDIPQQEVTVKVALREVRYCTETGNCVVAENDNEADVATVVIEQSDYPHGLIQFPSAASSEAVGVDAKQISFQVNRTYNENYFGATECDDFVSCMAQGTVRVSWEAVSGGDLGTLDGVAEQGVVTLGPNVASATGSIAVPVGSSLVSAKSFTLRIVDVTCRTEFGANCDATMGLISTTKMSVYETASTGVYNPGKCTGIASNTLAVTTDDAKACLGSLDSVNLDTLADGELDNVASSFVSVTTFAGSRGGYSQIGGEALAASVLNTLVAKAQGKLAAQLTQQFALSLLADCTIDETKSCPCCCERSVSDLVGDIERVFVSRKNAASLTSQPVMPSTVETFPSVTFPEELLDLPGIQRVNLSHCNDYYYAEYSQAAITFPSTSSEKYVIGRAVAVGVTGVTSQVVVNGTGTATFPNDGRVVYRVDAEGHDEPHCVYWNTEAKGWSGDGCAIDSAEGNQLTCSCNHMKSGFAATFGVLVNKRVMVSADVMIGSAVALIGAAALFLATVGVKANREKDHSTVTIVFSVAVFLVNLVWMIDLMVVGNEDSASTSLYIIGLALHFSGLLYTFAVFGTMLYIFNSVSSKSGPAAASIRYNKTVLPVTIAVPVVVILLYVIISMQVGVDQIYGDVYHNGGISFIGNNLALGVGFLAFVVVLFFATVYMVIMLDWQQATPSDDVESAKTNTVVLPESAQSKKTLIFAAMWSWVPIVVSLAAVMSNSLASELLLIVVLVIHGLILMWMAYSEACTNNTAKPTEPKGLGNQYATTTQNPVFNSPVPQQVGGMTAISTATGIQNMSASTHFNAPHQLSTSSSSSAQDGYLSVNGKSSGPDPSEFDDLIFNLRGDTSVSAL